MSVRLRATVGLAYPADPESLQIVQDAGGFSKLSLDVRAQVRVKEVAAGEFCDDVPPESLPLFLARGAIERVTVDERSAGPSEKKVRRDGR